MQIFRNDWEPLLADELQQPYYRELRQFLIGEYRSGVVYPDMNSIFNALHYTAYNDVKVVILGQDPYHEPGQAHGLSFSVLPGVEPPPSLKNIFKELATDLGCTTPDNGCLKPWADQGVLLLNAVLTVRAHNLPAEPAGETNRLHPLGSAGPEEKGHDNRLAAHGHRVRSPQSSLGSSGILRQPSLLAGKRLAHIHR